jgi:hypothetical protein
MNKPIVTAVALFGAGLTVQPNPPPFVPPTRCQPPAAIERSAIGLPEARGKATGADVWALFFHPLTANRKIKIVWRMTGAGKFTVAAFSPAGRRIDPDSAPVAHGSSNWTREGDEWGTWFTFPAPGCWDLHVTRAGSSGDLWIDVP